MEKIDLDGFLDEIDEGDPFQKLSRFRGLIEVIIDLAEEIAEKTATEYDDKIIAIIRNLIDRLLG
jgi:hypothetical protein